MITRLFRYFRDFQEYKTEYLRERLPTVGVSTYAGHDLDCGLDTYHLTHCTFPTLSVQDCADPVYNIYVNIYVNYTTIFDIFLILYLQSYVNYVVFAIGFFCHF